MARRQLLTDEERMALLGIPPEADAVQHRRDQGEPVPDALLAHTSPLTWEHIGFSGSFLWDRAAATAGRRRPLKLSRAG